MWNTDLNGRVMFCNANIYGKQHRAAMGSVIPQWKMTEFSTILLVFV